MALIDRIRRSLRLKLIVVSIGVEVLMLGLLLANSLRLMDNELERSAQAQVEDYRQLLDASLGPSLFQRDHASMTEMLGRLLRREDSALTYVLVIDDAGNPYAWAGAVDPESLPVLDDSVEGATQDGIYDAEGELKLDVLSIGRVRFGVSLQGFMQTQASLLHQGLGIAAIEVLLSLLLLGFAGYILTRHVGTMVAATRRVAGGEYDVRVVRQSEDEIGELADHFNRMTEAIRDRIAELKDSRRALSQEKERAWVTLHSIGDGVITTDSDGRVEMLNPIAEQLTGWTQEDALGKPVEEVFVIEDETTGRASYNPVIRCLRTNRIVELDDHIILIGKDGRSTPINDSAAPIHDGTGEIVGAVLVFHDMSSARQMASQLAFQARHDTLTGLVNRAEFERRLERAVESALKEDHHHVLCYLDLDQFKVINDTSGHIAGDDVLRQVSLILKGKVRDSDTLARLGGDEFGVLLENCPLERGAVVAEQMCTAVSRHSYIWDDKPFDIGVSIGVVAIDSDCRGMANVLSAADVACYLAKEQGRGRVYFHHEADEESARRKTEMHRVAQISAALADGRFELFVQEIRALKDDGAGRHYEVLVRMRDEDGERVSPAAFIPAAERFHLMHQVDQWVVDNVLGTIERHRLYEHDLRFSINLSGQTLAREEFLDRLVNRIQESVMPACMLSFEVTETAAISNLAHAGMFVTALKRLGCTFALDDFGSGLSSFAYLKHLKVDYLKIDGGFVRDMLTQESDAAMVEAINQMGHVMGLKTIAEYVENSEIQQRLTQLGVDYGQGFGLHEPMPMSELIARLNGRQVLPFRTP